MDEKDLKINTLENNYKSMSEKIDDLKDVVRDGFNEIKTDLKCFREDCDNKYASKLTEKIVYSMAGIILVSFLTAIVYLVINK
jgi:hypothetical protein